MTVSELLRSRKRFEQWMRETKDRRVNVNEKTCPIALYVKDMYGDDPYIHGPKAVGQVMYYDKQGRQQFTRLPEWARTFITWFDHKYVSKAVPLRRVAEEWEQHNAQA